MIKKNFLLILLILYSENTLAATITDVKKKTTDLIKANIKVEIPLMGKKLKEFFSNNNLLLDYQETNKEFKFQEKKYEVFEGNQLIEYGKWKVSGLLKNQIKLTPKSEKKPYYLKKIKNKSIIYHYDKLPGTKSANKTLVEIVDPKKKSC